MEVAVLTFEGFNEIDSLVASAMVNRVKQPGAVIVGSQVLDQPFVAHGKLATAGGCLL